MGKDFRIYLFGEFRLYRDGTRVSSREWHTRQARQLFKLLLTEYARPVSSQRLIDLLWPDEIEHPDKTLRSAMSMLRSVLEPERDAHTPSRFLPRGRAGYMLTFPPDCSVWLDTHEFECLLTASAQAHTASEKCTALEAALALYTDDYLVEDIEARWTHHMRARLRERYFQGVLALVELYNQDARFDDAIALSQHALRFDSCYEPLYRALMQSQAMSGNIAGALRTFEQCRAALDESLGADPSAQTLELHIAILNGAFHEFSPAQLSSSSKKPDTSRLPSVSIPTTAVLRSSRVEQQAVTPSSTPLVIGRDAELQWLRHLLHGTKEKTTGYAATVVALAGEAGVGKSFLLQRFVESVASARAEHTLVLSTTCQLLEQGLSFAPLVSLLSTWLYEDEQAVSEKVRLLPPALHSYLAPLLPELFPGETLTASPSEQSYTQLVSGFVLLFTKLYRSRPLVLVLDDVQWADELTLLVVNRLAMMETHDLTGPLAPTPPYPLLLLISYRPEDVSENMPLRTLLHGLGRNQRVHILPVHRFTLVEVEEYMRRYNVTSLLSAEQLYQATRGNGLFVAEAVRTLLEQLEQNEAKNDRENNGENNAASSPERVVERMDIQQLLLHSPQIRDIVLARMARLPQQCIELLELAAVMNRPFTIDMLGDEPTAQELQALDTLLARHFLIEQHEQDETVLAFSHELIQQIVYSTCTAIKLKRLHRTLLERMLRQYQQENRQALAAEIAYHALRAGSQYIPLALRYSVEAGDYSRRTFSYRQALVHYATALRLVQQLEDAQKTHKQVTGYTGHTAHTEYMGRTLAEWQRAIYDGQQLAYEAVFDWSGLQESHRHLSSWASAHNDSMLMSSAAHRLIISRSLMGRLPEAVSMGRELVERLEEVVQQPLSTIEAHVVRMFRDTTRYWVQFMDMDTVEESIRDNSLLSLIEDRYPAFQAPVLPEMHHWRELQNAIGPMQAAFLQSTFGWVLMLQGLNEEAERYLLAAERAARETDQEAIYIFAMLQLSRVASLSGRHEQGNQLFEQCLHLAQRLEEAPWTTIWPLLYRAYNMIEGRTEEAATLFHMLEKQLATQRDFVTHRYSTQIGLGLITLARGDLAQTETLMRHALANCSYLYIETYVLAENALAQLAALQGRYDEAEKRLYRTLAFCGQRSLLEYYSNTAFLLADILRQTSRAHEIRPLLGHIHTLLHNAGYVDLKQRCEEMLQGIV